MPNMKPARTFAALVVLTTACSSGTPVSQAGSGYGGSGTAPSSGQSGGSVGSGQITSPSTGQPFNQGTGTTGQTSTGSFAPSGSAGSSSGTPANTGSSSTDGGDAAGADASAPDGSAPSARRFACPPGPYPKPVAGQSQSVCGNFQFKYNWNEGPTWITSENAFFFSNFVQSAAGPGDIIKYTPGGQCETWVTNVGCNGLTAAYDGSLVAVCHTPRAVIAYDIVTKMPKTLASMYMGKQLDSPNDVVASSNGSIYFSNPTYELGARPVGLGPSVLYIDSKGTLQLIAKTGGQPNGMALSPDEKLLYVEVDGSGVKTYDLDANGTPSSTPKNFTGGTDGMSVDCAGNLYLSSGTIIGPNGQQVGTYPGGTMAAFGGADGKSLIVVGGTGVHLVSMNIPGPPH
jgi:gluconolactonase